MQRAGNELACAPDPPTRPGAVHLRQRRFRSQTYLVSAVVHVMSEDAYQAIDRALRSTKPWPGSTQETPPSPTIPSWQGMASTGTPGSPAAEQNKRVQLAAAKVKPSIDRRLRRAVLSEHIGLRVSAERDGQRLVVFRWGDECTK